MALTFCPNPHLSIPDHLAEYSRFLVRNAQSQDLLSFCFEFYDTLKLGNRVHGVFEFAITGRFVQERSIC